MLSRLASSVVRPTGGSGGLTVSWRGLSAGPSSGGYQRTRSERFFEEGRYTFSEAMWEHRLLFLCIPVVMMLARGAQERGWPETSAVVVAADGDSRTITYRYYCGQETVEHTQQRNWLMGTLEDWVYGSWAEQGIKRGDRIVVNLNPKWPDCSVYRPLPLAVWHLGLTKNKHPQKGVRLQQASS